MSYRDQVFALARGGERAAEIARALGITRQWVSQILKTAGFPSDTRPEPAGKRRQKLTPQQKAQRMAASRQRRIDWNTRRNQRTARDRGFSSACARAEGCKKKMNGSSPAYREGIALAQIYLSLFEVGKPGGERVE